MSSSDDGIALCNFGEGILFRHKLKADALKLNFEIIFMNLRWLCSFVMEFYTKRLPRALVAARPFLKLRCVQKLKFWDFV